MYEGIVILSHNGIRAVVHKDSVDSWLQRGFTALGPFAEDGDGILTKQEWLDEVKRRNAQINSIMENGEE